MEKSKRLELYKIVLVCIEQGLCIGFCRAIDLAGTLMTNEGDITDLTAILDDSLNGEAFRNKYPNPYVNMDKYPEIEKYKPIDFAERSFWFRTKQERIDALVNEIKELTKQLNTI